MGETIAVLSGKGGTGKTSVCAGVATALAEAGASVLCIDCDVGLRNLDISLGMSDSGGLSFLDVCQGGIPLSQAPEHSVYPNLRFLTAPVRCAAEAVDSRAFRELVRKAQERFAYVFLDAPGGVGAGFRLASGAAGRILLVTGADPAAIRDAARTAEVLELMGKTSVRLVVNRVNRRLFASMDITVDDVMDTAGLPLLGVVPEDPEVTLSAAFGQCLLAYSRKSPAAKAFRAIARRVEGKPVPISLR